MSVYVVGFMPRSLPLFLVLSALCASAAASSQPGTLAPVQRLNGSAPFVVYVGAFGVLPDDERRALTQHIGEDLDTRPGFNLLYGSALYEQAPLSPDELSRCVQEVRCLQEFADALGADVVIDTQLETVGSEVRVTARHLAAVPDAIAETRVALFTQADPRLREQAGRMTAHLVMPYATGSLVQLTVQPSEDDVEVSVDGLAVNVEAPVALAEGVHLFVARRDGFIPLTQYIDVRSSPAPLALDLVPTASYLDDYVWTAWAMRITGLTLLAFGTVFGVAGAGLGVGSFFAARATASAIADHNADPNRTQAQQDALLRSARLVNFGLTPSAAAVGTVGVVLLTMGAVVLLVSDSPSQYE